MKSKKWNIAAPSREKIRNLSRQCGYAPLTAAVLCARGLDTPLLIGGATTSALHTAVKLAPLYDHVFYGPDASASAVLAGRLMSDRKGTEAEEHEKQRKLRELYESRDTTRAEAPLKREPFPADSFLKGAFFENIEARSFSIGELLPYFDWQLF